MKVTWSIPHLCLTSTHAGILKRCISSIQSVYADHTVVVVDSDSTYKDHYDEFEKEFPSVVFLRDAKNRNYPTGAYKIVIDQFDSDYYVFIQDSCYLTGVKFDFAFSSLITPFNIMDSWLYCEEGNKSCDKLNVIASLQDTAWHNTPTIQFDMIVGEMGVFHKDIINYLRSGNYFNKLPTTKKQACEWERRFGIALTNSEYRSEIRRNQVLYPKFIEKNWLHRE